MSGRDRRTHENAAPGGLRTGEQGVRAGRLRAGNDAALDGPRAATGAETGGARA